MEGSTVVDPTHGLARNALGLPQVLFCIVTGAAPIAAMLFNDFWAVYGGGWAAPSAFIIATVAFTVFSVGYVAMARRVTAAGGFYSFTSHAFGQSAGMGVALLIAACYTIFAAGVTGVTAYFANTTVNDWFGVDIPVWVWEFGTIGIMVALAFFHIELTAKILGVFLILEVAALLIFGFATLFQPEDGLVLESLLPWNFFDSAENGSEAAFGAGTIGAGFFGAFWSWIGFEMAPNYAEESKDPKKIMGPATYISVIGLGILYTFVTWMLVVAYGKAGIIPGINAQLEGEVASVFYPATDRGDRDRHRERGRPHQGVRAHDRDRLVRVSARVLQHGHALLLLDGPRGRAAPRPRQDASRRTTARTSRARSSARSAAWSSPASCCTTRARSARS